MDKVRGLATVKDDNDILRVTFDPGVLPGMEREQLFQFLTAVANADAAITGHARYIYFYDPMGDKVGQASPLTGITLAK